MYLLHMLLVYPQFNFPALKLTIEQVVNPVINPPAGGSCDPTSRDCFGPVGGETVSFNTLPGGTTGNLDGTNWAGVQLSDMVIS